MSNFRQVDHVIGPASVGSTGWTFHKGGEAITIHPEGRIVVDAAEAATAAAVAGLGIASTGQGSVQAEIDAGTLAFVLPDWQIGKSDINVILPAGRAAKASARAFADFVARETRSIRAFSG